MKIARMLRGFYSTGSKTAAFVPRWHMWAKPARGRAESAYAPYSAQRSCDNFFFLPEGRPPMLSALVTPAFRRNAEVRSFLALHDVQNNIRTELE